jgi:TM2 domain-containing membrane protein YozV
MEFLYIGPGMGLGTTILVLIIAGIVVFSFGYIIWHKVKKLFKKK